MNPLPFVLGTAAHMAQVAHDIARLKAETEYLKSLPKKERKNALELLKVSHNEMLSRKVG